MLNKVSAPDYFTYALHFLLKINLLFNPPSAIIFLERHGKVSKTRKEKKYGQEKDDLLRGRY